MNKSSRKLTMLKRSFYVSFLYFVSMTIAPRNVYALGDIDSLGNNSSNISKVYGGKLLQSMRNTQKTLKGEGAMPLPVNEIAYGDGSSLTSSSSFTYNGAGVMSIIYGGTNTPNRINFVDGGYVHSRVGYSNLLELSAGSYFDGSVWRTNSTSSYGAIISMYQGTIGFFTNSGLGTNSSYNPTPKMHISATGGVGIGNIDPNLGGALNSKLTISQEDFTTAVAISNNSGTPRFAINGQNDGSWLIYDFVGSTWHPGLQQYNGNVYIGATASSFASSPGLGVFKNDHGVMEVIGGISSRINFRDNSQGTNGKVWEVLNYQGNFSVNRISDNYGTRTERFVINNNGFVKINSLGGNGNGVVAVDNAGNLSWTATTSGAGTSGWALGGNAATTSDFIGTTNNQSLLFKSNNIEGLRIIPSGQVGIATTSATSFSDASYKLFVEGGVRARKVKVDVNGWSDYVFYPNYNLPSLKEIEAFIKQHKHLPDVPSEAEVKKEGTDVAETQALLLKKIEELTLYIIEQDKRIERLEQEVSKNKK